MKKYLLLLLISTFAIGQTNPTAFKKIKVTDNVENTTPAFIGTQETDGVINKIPSTYIEKTANKTSTITGYSETLYPNEKATHDALDTKLNISDLPTNLTLYPTTAASDIAGYVKMVTDIHDVDYNTLAVDVSTPLITTTNQLISKRISAAGVLVGQPGVFNITTFGNIRHLSGSGTASFYFEVYKRTVGGVETLICTSSNSLPVTNGGYSEFSASAVWDDGTFLETDRIVIKSYANRIAGGSDPVYQFQFGGVSPVRTILPVPFSVVDAGYEVKINKQNSLAVDGTGIMYPTVDATNAGLALKANIDNPTFTGVLTNTNNIISTNTNGVPSRFGATPTNFLPVNLLDILSSVNTNFSSGDGHYRAISAIGEFSGTSSSSGTITGVSGRGTTAATSTGDLTLTTFGGGFKGGRFRAAHRGSGTITKASGVSADIQNTGGTILNSVVFNAEPAYVALDKTTNSHYAFLAEGGSVLGTLTNNHGLYINPLIGGINRWGVYQAGSTDKNYFAGNSLFGTTTDNSQGVAQFNGNITISDGTLANHAVTKSQLDLKQNTLTNPITGTGTANTFPIFTGTTTQGNSILTQTATTSVNVNGNIVAGTASPTANVRAFLESAVALTPQLEVKNPTASTTFQYAGIRLTPSFGSTVLAKLNNSATPYKVIKNGDFSIWNMASGDIVLFNDRVGGKITFATNASSTDMMTLTTAGNLLVNKITDDGVNKGQFEGTVSAFPATISNQVVVKSQLDLVASKWNASGADIISNNTDNVYIGTTNVEANSARLGVKGIGSVNNIQSWVKSNGAIGAYIDTNGGITASSTSSLVNLAISEFMSIQPNKSINGNNGGSLSLFSRNTYWELLGRIDYNTDYSSTYTDRSLTDKSFVDKNRMKSFTVATLPASPTQGDSYAVTDALAPAYLVTVVGGGTVYAPVVWNGTNWVTH